MKSIQKACSFLATMYLGFAMAVCYGQNSSDSVKTSGFRLAIDVLKPVSSLSNAAQPNLQLESALSFNRRDHIYITEIAFSNSQFPVANYTQRVKGLAIRLGYEKNLMKKGDDQIAFGGRFGQSWGRFQATEVSISDPFWGSAITSLPARNSYFGWLEATASARVGLNKWVGVGFTLRLQRLLYANVSVSERPDYLPGYGNTTRTIGAVLNYWIIFHIPTKYHYLSAKALKSQNN